MLRVSVAYTRSDSFGMVLFHMARYAQRFQVVRGIVDQVSIFY
jgi:hypothetical protein